MSSDSHSSPAISTGQSTSTMIVNGSSPVASSCSRSDAGFSGGVDVREMRLPRSMFRKSAGVAFDVGNSMCKVAFLKNVVEGSDETTDDEKVTVVLSAFPINRFDDALAFVSSNSGGGGRSPTAGSTPSLLRVTGMSMSKDRRAAVERLLNAKVELLNEFGPMSNSVRRLVDWSASGDKNVYDQLFFRTSDSVVEEERINGDLVSQMIKTLKPGDDTVDENCSETASATATNVEQLDRDDGNNNNSASCNSDTKQEKSAAQQDEQYPFVILCVGSAMSMIKVDRDGSVSFMGGLPDGGVCLLSLAKLLIGTDNFDEFMELAGRGDETKVSTTISDRRPDKDDRGFYSAIPDYATLASFGKVLDGNFNGYAREDMARAILTNSVASISLSCLWAATEQRCRCVYAVGGFFEHRVARDWFESCFTTYCFVINKPIIKLKIFKQSQFLTVLGSLMDE